MNFLNCFKKKENPYKYKMLCKNCDIFFEVDDPSRERKCPVCGTSNRIDTYSVINKETGKEFL